ncbi:hyaluronate lyase TcHly8B [Thermasporomyces composti]|jgi:hyaluronate lyase|uniref:Hyaluronate lyase n=1 Tax=Thermasporomyces composti TaxID=696763 RepID=HYSA_THECX|nr:hyaluronate lyase TcHly8B [Thermasporomyces composti]A0A3D9VCI6.1 RecName: Full=Hyaluronate lyase; AltName: Full=Hyaluronidase; Short=HYase; AltName: Full=TcHly8B; Flags: Precursor [Thermasporomyces composti]REF35884.1 hyaluronate lyase [Thermasporomyces composti]
MSWNRRSFLGALGVTCLAGAGMVPIVRPRTAAAADEFDLLRERWCSLVTGSGYDPDVEPFKSRLAALGAEAEQYLTTLAPGETSLWPDLPLDTSTWNMTLSARRLRTMAVAYLVPGTGHTGNSAMAEAAVTAFDELTTRFYAPPHWWGNWWDWLIGTPQALNDFCALLYEQLGPELIDRYVQRVDHYVDPGAIDRTTGANRGWLCEVTAVRGVLGKSPEMMAKARDGLSPIMVYVTDGDGFYRDGSFIQHEYYAYTGSYGISLLQSVSGLFALLAGSTWEIVDPNRQVLFDSIENSFAPFVYNGLLMDAVAGRVISREAEHDHWRGHLLAASVLRMAEAGSPEEAKRWRGIVKGWLLRESEPRYMGDQTLTMAAVADAQAVLDDPTIEPLPEPVEHRIFAAMDQAVHRRPTWAFSISMRSVRTAFYETINGENLKGWHTGVGMTYWWGADFGNDHYTDGFWPTADPYRLPGTTVSRKPLEDGVGNNVLPTEAWAGGTTDGEFAAVGQSIQALESTLRGRKSWFCLDDAVVCLGAGITCADGYAVDTTVDQRNLGENGVHDFRLNGIPSPTSGTWSLTVPNARWAHLEGFGGYVFPGGARVSAIRETRTGSWYDINVGGPRDELRRRYVTVYLDHGVDPVDASYVYLVMPGATRQETIRRAADRRWLRVLANTADRQAISVPSLGFVGANFFAPGTVDALTVDQPCSVLVRVADGRATICVSDPRQDGSTVRVTWNRPVASVVSSDPTVRVVEAGERLVLDVTVEETAGMTQRAVVALA